MKKAGWVALFLCAALWMVGVTGSAVEEGTPLPVLMYHALLRNPNAWNDYVLSPDALEQDLIWLKAHGYSFVLPSQVIGFVQNRNPLPEKPVMITLDDGCLNHLTYLPEILERQDACAFLSVVGEYTEKADAEGEGQTNAGKGGRQPVRLGRGRGNILLAADAPCLRTVSHRRGTCSRRHGWCAAS